MALKKRLATFVSNWLGVIIAAVIVIISATFGGMYLYGRSRVDNAINFAIQAITVRPVNGLTLSGTVDTPPGYIFHLVFQAFNPYTDTIEISISDISISMDTYTLVLVKDGSWDKTTPTGYQFFEGDMTIDTQTYDALVQKGTVDVDIKGNISASGQYKWIKRQGQRVFDIPLPGVIFKLISG